jgi:hypothetical protein
MLDWTTGAAAATQPAARWVGLAGGTPTSVSGSELGTAQGYFSRVTALFAAANSPAGTCSISAAMTFGPFSSAQSVLGLVMFDGSPIGSSNMLWYGTLQTARTLAIGDQLVFAAGALTLVLS